MRMLCWALLGLVPGLVAAQDVRQAATMAQESATAWRVVYQSAPGNGVRSISGGVSGAVEVLDKFPIRTPGGGAGEIVAKRTMTQSAARAFAGRALGVAGVAGSLAAAGLAIYDWLDSKGVFAGPSGSWLVDPGAPKVPGLVFRSGLDGKYYPQAGFLQKELEWQTQACNSNGYGSCSVVTNTSSLSGNTLTYRVRVNHYNTMGLYDNAYISDGSVVGTQSQICPDFVGPVHVVYDGGCPSQNRVIATPAQLETAASGIPDAQMPKVIEQAAGIPGVAGIPAPLSSPTPAVTSTPTAITDPNPEVTTNPDGSTVTRTKQWTIDTTSNPGVITMNPRETIVNKDSSGTSTGTTTKTGGTGGATDVPTECDKHPTYIGCRELGTPQAESVPGTSKAISFTPDTVGDAGSCPGDRSFTVAGKTYKVAFAPVCSAVTDYVRPFVLMFGGLAAAFIFVGGFKS